MERFDAMRQENAVAHAETRAVVEAGLSAATGAREMAEAFRGEARILHEDTMQAIGAVVDGLNMLRESVDRRAEDRARDGMDRHIAPLKAIAHDHQERITALENRLK